MVIDLNKKMGLLNRHCMTDQSMAPLTSNHVHLAFHATLGIFGVKKECNAIISNEQEGK